MIVQYTPPSALMRLEGNDGYLLFLSYSTEKDSSSNPSFTLKL
jgi:hypothetical protein